MFQVFEVLGIFCQPICLAVRPRRCLEEVLLSLSLVSSTMHDGVLPRFGHVTKPEQVVHTRTQERMHTRTHARMHAHARTHMHMRAHTCTHTHTHTHTHTRHARTHQVRAVGQEWGEILSHKMSAKYMMSINFMTSLIH